MTSIDINSEANIADIHNVINRVKKAIEYIRRGKMVIGTDRVDRENEGDLIMAAEMVQDTDINFMAMHARGLICLAMDASVVDRLQLPPMTMHNQSKHHTNFTTSIEARDPSVTTGISASDRACTIRTAARPECTPEQIIHVGHVFPLRAKRGGVLERAGHTEMSTDLVILAGMTRDAKENKSGTGTGSGTLVNYTNPVSPCAVICEIMAHDGNMARQKDLQTLSEQFDLPMLSVDDVITYRKHFELTYISKVPRDKPEFAIECSGFVQVPMAPSFGADTAQMASFASFRSGLWNGNQEILVLLFGEAHGAPCCTPDQSVPLVRVHSQCLTGDLFGSMRCDCGDQLQLSMQRLSKESFGILIYVPYHEGRGIGIFNKICAYRVQDQQALDTLEANIALNLPADARDYEFVAKILLQHFDIDKIRLITNNPDKIRQLQQHGIKVVERVKLQTSVQAHNQAYLKTKCSKLGHHIDM